jgi:protein-tyrosine sulfotransferase
MAKIFGLTREQRQRLWDPVTLRLAQIGLDLFRRPKVTATLGSDYPSPFFIVGSGRSGTTLLRSILQEHPALNIPPETMGRLPNMIKKYFRYGGADWEDLVTICLAEFQSFDTFSFWQTDLEPVQQQLRQLPKNERSLDRIIHDIYRAHGGSHKPGATRWGDKSPFNTLRLSWLDRVFPDAQYIEIIRDGRDVARSYRQADLMPDLASGAQRWEQSIRAVTRFKRKAGNRVHSLRYENLVADPESEIRKVCNFLNLDYRSSMITARDSELGDTSLEHMQNVTQPISEASIGKWKETLTAEELKRLQNEIGQTLKQLGYEES